MRKIDLKIIKEAVKLLFVDAAENINDDLLESLNKAFNDESSELGKSVLQQIIDNDLLAKEKHVPMCQDTGVSVVFIEMGSEVWFVGDLEEAVNEGVKEAYVNHYLRKSRYTNPITRDTEISMRDHFIIKVGDKWYSTGTSNPIWTGPNPGVRLLESA